MSRIRLLLLLGAVMPLAACGADDVASPGEGVIVTPGPTPTPTPAPTPTPTPGVPAASCPDGLADIGIVATVQRRGCKLPSRVTGNLRLRNLPGVVYALNGRVDVGTDVGADGNAVGGAGAVLTIDPGVVLYGSSGADFLLVNRGSQIFAEGTATAPIIMTSRANIDGTTNANSQGQWGGLVVLGRAPISDCLAAGAIGGTVACQNQVEGTTNALYGGASPSESSGRLRYLQVRFAGFELAPNNELNGITLGGVGSGTVIDHIQVHNSSDDAIEWFGGRANAKYLVLDGNDDDSIDTDFGYKGFLQYVLVVQRDGGQSGDAIIEADSNNGLENNTPRQNTKIANFTFIHRSQLTAAKNAVLLRGGTDYTLVNGIITTPRACIDLDHITTAQAANPALDEAGPPVFQSVVMQCGTTFADDGDIDIATIKSFFDAGANNNSAFTTSLTDVFVNGAKEAAVPAFNASTLSSFFDQTDYIGAVKNAADTWYKGWTCGAQFGGTPCEAVAFIDVAA